MNAKETVDWMFSKDNPNFVESFKEVNSWPMKRLHVKEF